MLGPAHTHFEINGRHVLAALIGFFLTVAAVNGYFVHQALTTHTGVVAKEPYRKGLKYNERIVLAERQAALGWTEDLDFADDGRLLAIKLTDQDGAPVRRLTLSALLGRPATKQGERVLTLHETEPGLYETDTGGLEPGAYIASFEARREEDVVFRGRRRLWLDR